MVTIENNIWVAANNMDAVRDKVGRRSTYVSPRTVNFRGNHLSILSHSLVHWPKTCYMTPLFFEKINLAYFTVHMAYHRVSRLSGFWGDKAVLS